MKIRFVAALLAISLGSPALAGWEEAVDAYNKGDYATAATEFRPFAEQGQATAQYILGWIFQNGQGVAQDYAESARWYQRAADKGNADAQYALGSYYMSGVGVAQNDEQAVAWFRKAAEQGRAGAQYLLGYMTARGEGTTKDEAQAAQWYLKAAEQGYTEAEYAYALALRDGTGVEKDDEASNEWLRKAAAQGHVEAAYLLGWNAEKGIGGLPDYTEAARWYRQAADAGNAEAQYQLAVLLRDGLGVTRDDDAALALFKQAATAGQASVPTAIDAYVKSRSFDRAFALADTWLDTHADDVQLLTLLGFTAANEARTDPDRFTAPARRYGERAIALIENGTRPESMAAQEWDEYQTKWLPQLYMRLGVMAQKAGRLDEALARFGKVTELSPQDPYGWYLLGQTHFAKYERITAESKGLSGQAKSDAIAQAFGELDQVIDLYAHAIGLAAGRDDMKDLHDPLMKDLSGIYEFRNGSRKGLDDVLAKYRAN